MEEKKYKVISFLNRAELDLLDTLEKDIYFTYNIHIPRTKLIEEIIDLCQAKEMPNKQALEAELLRMFQGMENKGK